MKVINTPKVSVIIPVYNMQVFLRRCLDSVVNQSLRDIEIICVNDASKDDSLAILQEYAAKDSRIQVVDLAENKGVSGARNTGMALAQGEYLGFVDSDDMVDLNFYESLYAKACVTSAFIVKGLLEWVEENGDIRKLPSPDVHADKLLFTDFFYSAIYETAFIRGNGIIFPVGITNGEDHVFLAKAVSLAPFVETVVNSRYYYLRNPNSAYREERSKKDVLSVLKSLEDVIQFLNFHNVDDHTYAKICSRRIFMALFLYTQAEKSFKVEAVSHCIDAAIRLYSMCNKPQIVDAQLYVENPVFAKHIIESDVDGLAKFLEDAKPLNRVSANSLRARLRQGKHDS